MNASLRWLGELLGRQLEAKDVRDRLAMLGAPVDAMEPLRGDLAGVVIGEVLEVTRHPNADRLTLCLVNAGAAQPLKVVCGATNVVAGRRYPFAPAGVTLPGGVKLERRKIRGEVSEGMLCSARELGLGEDGEGILELDTDARPGTPLLDALRIADTRLVIDVTPNRPDLLSHEGLARDLGAVLGLVVKLQPIPGAPSGTQRIVRAAGREGTVAGVRVVIEDVQGCPRYAAAVVRGVTIGPSPRWLSDRLAAVGQRTISNVVDATNYLMLENGQPLHAFDLGRLEGPAIVVRRPRPGERLTTLDGETRALPAEATLIADAVRPTAIAGVMGGAGSEVSERTTDVLIECAYFDPRRTRATRRALGLSTEASYRFERGVDFEATAERLLRAAELVVAVAGGRIEGATDVYPEPIPPRTIFVRESRLAHVLGVELARADVERALTALGCVVGPREGRLAVQVPGWRPDLVREIDLIEEVARIVGYDRFPDELKPFRPGTVPDAPVERVADRLRELLTGLGLHEAMTLSLGPRTSESQPAVLNPLSQEEAYLRSDLLTGLKRRVEHNWRQMTRDVRLFEIGHVFDRSGGRRETADGREYALPREENFVAGVITGARRPPHWSDPDPPDCDLFDVKALLEQVVAAAQPGGAVESSNEGFLVRRNERVIGRAVTVPAEGPAWAAPVFGFELSLEEAASPSPSYRPLPAWPAIQRDAAFVLPEALEAGKIEPTLREAAGALLERLWVFDEYRGPPLAAGERGVAWRFVFRARDRTLKEAEADAALERAVKAGESKHGIRRR